MATSQTSTPILMPSPGSNAAHARLAKWLIAEGQSIQPGDIIAEIETANATMEVEAVDAGTVGKLLVQEGTDNVPTDTPIALIDPPARDTAAVTEADLPTDTPMKSVTIRQALHDAICEEMRRDETVFLLGEDVRQTDQPYRVTNGLFEEFGARRIIDTPVTEQAFTGLAIGAAFAGLRPIVEYQSWSFALQAADQIINSAAKSRYRTGGKLSVPIVLRGPNGGSGQSGAQHSQCLSALFAHIPGLKVVAPANASDARGLMIAAIRDPDPVLVLENEALYGHASPVPSIKGWTVTIGKARIIRDGGHVTIVAYSRAVRLARTAAEHLASDGIEAEIIDLRSIRPIDLETVYRSVRKTNRIVCVEESWPFGSVGSEICARVAMDCFDDLDAPPAKVSGADVPMPFAANLERLALPAVQQVVTAAREVCYV